MIETFHSTTPPKPESLNPVALQSAGKVPVAPSVSPFPTLAGPHGAEVVRYAWKASFRVRGFTRFHGIRSGLYRGYGRLGVQVFWLKDNGESNG